MPAKLMREDKPFAELADDGKWVDQGCGSEDLGILNTLFDPRQPEWNGAGSHHNGFGSEAVSRAAITFGCKAEYPPLAPLPEGDVS